MVTSCLRTKSVVPAGHHRRVITWATLTSGAIGSVFTALVTFGAVMVTLWRTRVGDRTREAVRLAEVDADRRRAVVAEVIGAFRAMEAEVRAAPFLPGRSDAESLRVTMLFYVSMRQEHLHIANWVLVRHQAYADVVQAWRRVWWIPFIRRRRLTNLVEFMGKTIGTLSAWAVGDLRDDWFEDSHRQPPPAAVLGPSAISD